MSTKQPTCQLLCRCRKNIAEKSYRRGYQHGWLFALKAIDEGATTEELRIFAKGRIQDWRYSRAKGLKMPPEFKHGLP